MPSTTYYVFERFVTSARYFILGVCQVRTERRSAQASALALSQAQGGLSNKKTPEGVYAGCVGVRKNCRYVEWQWKVE